MAKSGAPCVGCLGSHECWVCLGRGDLGPGPRFTTCPRCDGTGRCSLCATPVIAVGGDDPGAGSRLERTVAATSLALPLVAFAPC